MHGLIFIIGLTTAVLVTGQKPNNDNSFGLVVTTPLSWVSGTNESVCLVSQTGSPSLQVTVSVHKPTQEKILMSTFTLPPGQSSCVTLLVANHWNVYKVILLVEARDEGSDYTFSKNGTISIKKKNLMMFIQTDKPVYKPSDVVRIRILSLIGPDLKAATNSIKLAYMEDPSKTRLMQWTNLNISHGLASIEMPLSSEPPLGTWTVKVLTEDQEHSHNFEVKEYVLPKYSVEISSNESVFLQEEEVKWRVCARYTYGEPVSGNATTKICLKTGYGWNHKESCVHHNNSVQLTKGCYEFSAPLNELIKEERYYMSGRSLEFLAEVKEHGTGVAFNTTSKAQLVNHRRSIDLTASPSFYKPGMTYYGKGTIKNLDNSPVSGKTVYIRASGTNEMNTDSPHKVIVPVTTDERGKFEFNITAQFIKELGKNQMSIGASEHAITSLQPPRRHGQMTVQDFSDTPDRMVTSWYSASDSYLQIQAMPESQLLCKSNVVIQFKYNSKTELPMSAQFSYQVTSRDNILTGSSGVVEGGEMIRSNDTFSYNFTLRLTLPVEQSSMGSLNVLIFYIRPDGELIADSITTPFEHCFQNKVSASFNDLEGRPGQETSLHLTADADSLCSISVVDKSIELMGAKYMSKASVTEMLKSLYISISPISHFDSGMATDCVPQNEGADGNKRPADFGGRRLGRSYIYGGSSQYVDSQKPFKDLSLLVLTDRTVTTKPCPLWYHHRVMHTALRFDGPAGMPGLAGARGPIPMVDQERLDDATAPFHPASDSKTAPKTLHRTFFPETWLWDLHTVGSTGTLKVPVTLPHTITEWIGNGYCVSSKSGLGIASPFAVKAFQPFFVSFTLPYSMIRGEEVAVPVSVFNYLTECLKVNLMVEKSEAFSLVNDSSTASVKVCGQQTVVHTFYVVPNQLGNINFTVQASSKTAEKFTANSVYTAAQTNAEDIVTRQLLVEAEGKPEEITKSDFICGSGSGEWSFSLPPDTVSDSERSHIAVIGDVMGPALSGLDSLLAMPMGCGEQNMLLFAPNIYVMQYLNKTNRLTPDIQSKALSHMQIGYQRELTYRHTDGSYSAFGNSDPEGSIWLTAFVVKSFAQAKKYMFIDDKDLQMSTDWITSKQLENGCFPMVGKVLHKEMTGGLQGSNTAALTSFILIALLETGLTNQHPTIEKALRCLSVQSVDDVYTLSLMSYAYSVASPGGVQYRNVMSSLDNRAIVTGDMKYWKTDAVAPEPGEYHHSSPANVEVTAYVLLSMVQGDDDLSNIPSAIRLVRWLSSQRNAYGGFSSTQDTVLALQALALYAGKVHRDDINVRVRMASNGVNFDFNINHDNSLLLQKREGLAAHNRVHYTVDGVGCALVQASIRFNRLSLLEDQPPSFALKVDAQEGKGSKKKCSERIINICARYNGTDAKTNMAVIAVKMVSGWTPDKSSIEKLKNMAKLQMKRFDIDKNVVQIYFDEFDKKERCFDIMVTQEQQVEDAKPALVHVYDYYAPSSAAFAQYSIMTTCRVREARSNKANQLQQPVHQANDRHSPKKPSKNSEDKKSSKCPVCQATPSDAFMRKICSMSLVYKMKVGNNSSLVLQEVLKFNFTSKQPGTAARFTYRLPPKCVCPSLVKDAEILIASPKKFDKKGQDWMIKLKQDSRIVTFGPTTVC